jgi:hypothetical protein
LVAATLLVAVVLDRETRTTFDLASTSIASVSLPVVFGLEHEFVHIHSSRPRSGESRNMPPNKFGDNSDGHEFDWLPGRPNYAANPAASKIFGGFVDAASVITGRAIPG